MTVQTTGASPVEALASLAGATPAATAPVTPPSDPVRDATNPEPPKADTGRAGGPDALRADLASERDARHAAETKATEAAAKLDAVLTALGIGGKVEDPTRALAETQKANAAAQAELAAVRNAPKGTDIVSLLDSRRFVNGLANVDPANGKAVSDYITKYLEDNPPAGVRYAGGAGDVRQPGDPASGSSKTFDDLIRGR